MSQIARRISSHMFVLATGLAIAACTIQSTQSNRIGTDIAKVAEIHVIYIPTVPPKGTVAQYGYGPQFITPDRIQTASSSTLEYAAMFQAGFRDRFPAMAAKYGLTVSAIAPARLIVQITGTKTTCTAKCVTRVDLSANLVDGANKPLWHFQTSPGQSSIFAKIDAELFDVVARTLLDSMKKDGIIA
jgi:hypothetical protein